MRAGGYRPRNPRRGTWCRAVARSDREDRDKLASNRALLKRVSRQVHAEAGTGDGLEVGIIKDSAIGQHLDSVVVVHVRIAELFQGVAEALGIGGRVGADDL